MKEFVNRVSSFFGGTDEQERRGKCVLRPTHTRDCGDTGPTVQRQSASAAPGIATAPRSVVQVPMTDAETTGFREVSVPASAAVQVPEEEG